jgi:hypothetical protein
LLRDIIALRRLMVSQETSASSIIISGNGSWSIA